MSTSVFAKVLLSSSLFMLAAFSGEVFSQAQICAKKGKDVVVKAGLSDSSETLATLVNGTPVEIQDTHEVIRTLKIGFKDAAGAAVSGYAPMSDVSEEGCSSKSEQKGSKLSEQEAQSVVRDMLAARQPANPGWHAKIKSDEKYARVDFQPADRRSGMSFSYVCKGDNGRQVVAFRLDKNRFRKSFSKAKTVLTAWLTDFRYTITTDGKEQQVNSSGFVYSLFWMDDPADAKKILAYSVVTDKENRLFWEEFFSARRVVKAHMATKLENVFSSPAIRQDFLVRGAVEVFRPAVLACGISEPQTVPAP